MPASLLKHPLAVLRTFLDLGQQELADLVGCSISTVQAVETGRLQLSNGLATKISHQTLVDPGWLLAGDPKAPIRPSRAWLEDEVELSPRTYTREHFEYAQSSQRRAKTGVVDSLMAVQSISRIVLDLLQIVDHDVRKGIGGGSFDLRVRQIIDAEARRRGLKSRGRDLDNPAEARAALKMNGALADLAACYYPELGQQLRETYPEGFPNLPAPPQTPGIARHTKPGRPGNSAKAGEEGPDATRQ